MVDKTKSRKGISRRQFMKTTATAGTVAATVAASNLPMPAIAQGRKELRLVTSWPKNFPGLGTGANRVAERITKATGGRFTVRVYAANELVNPLKCLDAIQEGTADMYHSADYYYQGKSKAYNFFATVPMGMTATEHFAWLMHGGGQALWDDLGAQFGVKHFPGGATGVQMGGWFNKPMKSLEDFKGLKMRIPGLGGDVIKELGGTSVTLAGGDILPALTAGTIDATEWVGPWNDLAFGFYKAVKFYHYPGFHEPATVTGVGMSKKLWDDLSAEDKEIFTSVCYAECSYTLAEFNANNASALDTLIKSHGVKLVEFSDDTYKAFNKASLEVLANAAASDATTKKVHDSYMGFRKMAASWQALADQSFMNKRTMVGL
ncbi:MAG: TRAP transporter substrate-binding protein [Deltaproteobacteria bacterium]|nr:TRAP transporter substrate-binding protein [Deltaproteobacteria bacterium]